MFSYFFIQSYIHHQINLVSSYQMDLVFQSKKFGKNREDLNLGWVDYKLMLLLRSTARLYENIFICLMFLKKS